MSKNLTKRSENYSKWYNELVVKADLAENAAVRGCMIIKPYGYAIWEKIQSELDKMFKATGHKNAYFPLFVPKHLFEAEEKNAEGFAKECAIVTHYRLKTDAQKKGKLIVDPEAKLEEELVVRPTSEAIIWSSYKNWIRSYRDLPIKINQWANVVRWEMRPRLFLRTTEFLWQEGHTAHETKEEAIEEAEQMNNVYKEFVEKTMAIPVEEGTKTESERFAGAEETYCIEALMQDGKALQAGTSHFLGQNFAKAFDKGLVLPPKLAPTQVIIIPIYKEKGELDEIEKLINVLKKELEKENILVECDYRDNFTPGYKFNEYELKGIPIRIAIGPKDLKSNKVEVFRRDTLEKLFIPNNEVVSKIKEMLDDMQQKLYQKAFDFKEKNIVKVNDFEEFKRVLEEKGGFVLAHWDGTLETEQAIKKITKATIRCIPKKTTPENGFCVYSKKPSQQRVLFAKAY